MGEHVSSEADHKAELSPEEKELVRAYGRDIDAMAGTAGAPAEALAEIDRREREVMLERGIEPDAPEAKGSGRRIRIPASEYLATKTVPEE